MGLFLWLSWVSHHSQTLTLLAMNSTSSGKSLFSGSFASPHVRPGKSPRSTAVNGVRQEEAVGSVTLAQDGIWGG